MENIIGKYFGPDKIKDCKKIKEKTYLGNEKVELTFNNGGKYQLPLKVVKDVITVKEVDLTELRERRVIPIVTELLTTLVESELKKADLQYAIGLKLTESINETFAFADSLLWGKTKDDITMRDADLVMKNHKKK